jgi:hypothetical protein
LRHAPQQRRDVTVTLACDSPDCTRTTPAVVSLNRCAAPEGWWMQVSANRLIVACCPEHFNAALHAQVGQVAEKETT